MPIKFKAVSRINPRDVEAPKKFYASPVNKGELTLDSLSKQIAMMSTVSKTDVYAVLISLTEMVPLALEEGKIVRLGSLGSFSVGMNSEASLSADEVSHLNVKKLLLRFRPSAEMKKTVANFPVEKES